MNGKRVPASILIFFLLILAVRGFSQVAATTETSPLPFHSYSGGKFDHVQMQNGSLFFKIPLFDIPQLGATKFSFSIVGQSSARVPFAACATVCSYYFASPDAAPATEFGEFYYSTGARVVHDQAVGLLEANDTETGAASYAIRKHFTLREGDGTSHQMGYDSTDYSVLHATDGSGWTVHLPISNAIGSVFAWTGTGNPIAYDADGNRYEIGNSVSVMRDPFNNSISAVPGPPVNGITLSNTFTGFSDSISRTTIPFPNQNPVDPSGCPNIGVSDQVPTSSVLWSVPGPNGGMSSYRLCYTTIPLKTNYWKTNAGGDDTCVYIDVPDPSGNGNVSQELQCWGEEHGGTGGLQSIVLPDASFWAFIYDSAQTGAQYTYGDIVEIRTPEGGKIHYTYSDLGTCGDSEPGPTAQAFGSIVRAITKRVVSSGNSPDIVTDYQYSSTKTTETTAGSDTEHFFTLDHSSGCGANETTTKYWQGSANSGSLLKQVDTVFSSTESPQSTPLIVTSSAIVPAPKVNAVPVQVTTLTTGQATTHLTNEHEAHFIDVDPYSSSGNHGEAIYDLASLKPEIKFQIATATVDDIKNVKTPSYFSTHTDYKVKNFFNLRASVETLALGNDGARFALKTFHYDGDTNDPQEVKGRMTSIEDWRDAGLPAVISATEFNSSGEISKSTDPNGNITNVDAFQCSGLFPSSITRAYGSNVSETTVDTRDCNTGALLTMLDPNGISTIYERNDPLGRLKKIRFGVGTLDESNTLMSYPSRTLIETAKDKDTKGDGAITTTTKYDGLGRLIQQTDPAGYVVDTAYDNAGNIASISNPYHLITDPDYGFYTSFAYDALGRETAKCNPDNGSGDSCTPLTSYQSWEMTGNQVISRDERGIKSKRLYDSLGRLSDVYEDSDGINLHTEYAYSGLNDLSAVIQHGDTASPIVRRFSYDPLSRLHYACNPEALPSGQQCDGSHWSMTYGYDLNGNLISRSDSKGITTTYGYDALGRTISKTYSDSTLSSCYLFDSDNASGSNTRGRLVSEWTQPGSCPQNPSGVPSTAISWKKGRSYHPMGWLTDELQCAVAPCATGNPVNYHYDLAGNVTTSNSGLANSQSPQIGWVNDFDSSRRLLKLSSNWTDPAHPEVLFKGNTYGPFGLTAAQYGFNPTTSGSALSETRIYDRRGRITDKQVLGSSGITPPAQPSFTVSLAKPTISLNAVQAITVSASCSTSCGTGSWTVDGVYQGGFTLPDGGVFVLFADTTGMDTATAHTVSVNIPQFGGTVQKQFNVVGPALQTPNTQLTFSANPVTYGQPLTATVTVGYSDNFMSSGKVFIDGAYVQGFNYTPSQNNGQFGLQINNLTAGSHPYLVTLQGTPDHPASSASQTIVVNPAFNVSFARTSINEGGTQGLIVTSSCQSGCGTGSWTLDGVYQYGFGFENGGTVKLYIPTTGMSHATHSVTVTISNLGGAASPQTFDVVGPALSVVNPTIQLQPDPPINGQQYTAQIAIGYSDSFSSDGKIFVDNAYVAGFNYDASTNNGLLSFTLPGFQQNGPHSIRVQLHGTPDHPASEATKSFNIP